MYLIAGGMGGLGLVIAEHLARHFEARLVLLGRKALPRPDDWKAALASNATPDRIKERIRRMNPYYVDAIRKAQPAGPYRLVGHSFGGIVAYEVAQQLIAQGCTVGLLGLFDTIEWHYREKVVNPLGFRGRLLIYKSDFILGVRERHLLGPLWKRFKGKTSKLILPIRRALGLPLRERPRTIRDAHLMTGANYQPKVYPDSLTLFRSTSRELFDGNDEYLGWGTLVAGGIDVHHVPSTHRNMKHEPMVRILAATLRKCLDRDHAENGLASRAVAPRVLTPL